MSLPLYGYILITSSLLFINLSFAYEHIVEELAKRHYEKFHFPTEEIGVPTIVSGGVQINSISSIDEKNMQVALDIYLRQEWLDERVRDVTQKRHDLHGDAIDLFWLPDPYFPEAKAVTIHKVLGESRTLQLEPSGRLTYIVRLTIDLFCPMRFEAYPLDDQRCPVRIESFSTPVQGRVYKWNETSPVTFKKDMIIPKFQMSGDPITSNYTNKEAYRSGTFSGIRVDINLHREFIYYLTQVYFPSALVVVLSWVSFLVDVESAPARVSLGLLTVLTITTQNNNANADMPKVSYIKALDIWLAVCLAFVILAFLEYAVVSNMFKRTQRGREKQQKTLTNKESVQRSPVNIELLERSRANGNNRVNTMTSEEEVLVEVKDRQNNMISKYRRIDYVARILFPVSFLVFNVIYWVALLFFSNHHVK